MLITDIHDLLDFLNSAGEALFRLETLDRYAVPSDGGDYGRYLAGEPGPDPQRKAAWHAELQAKRDRGVYLHRVHVVRSPLSPYLRYEFEWAHRLNLPWEDIRVADLAANPAAAPLADVGDFWMADSQAVAAMRYDGGGRFLGYELAGDAELPLYRAVRDIAWLTAEPFSDYWDDHPQFWRGNRQAA